MQIALISLDSAWENREESYKRVEEAYNEMISRGKDPDLILLPEMFSTGFTMDVEKAADKKGESISFLGNFARKNKVSIIAGICEDKIKDGPKMDRPFNISVAIDEQGQILGRYIKRHLFPLAGEEKMMQPGDSFNRVDIKGFGIVQFVCYDLRFPEDFRNAMEEFGSSKVQAFSVVANWPATRDMHWRTLLQARAIENQCYVFACNRRGRDGNDLLYCGSSMVIGPEGTVIKDDQRFLPWVVTDVNVNAVEELREKLPIMEC